MINGALVKRRQGCAAGAVSKKRPTIRLRGACVSLTDLSGSMKYAEYTRNRPILETINRPRRLRGVVKSGRIVRVRSSLPPHGTGDVGEAEGGTEESGLISTSHKKTKWRKPSRSIVIRIGGRALVFQEMFSAQRRENCVKSQWRLVVVETV